MTFFRQLALATINLSTKFKLSPVSTHYTIRAKELEKGALDL